MKGKSKAFLIILAIFSALFFISDLSQAAVTPECPNGYTLNGNLCQADPICQNGSYNSTVNYCTANPTCSSGYTLNGSLCEATPPCQNGSYNSTVNYCTTNPTCSSGYTLSGNICEADPLCPCGSYDSSANYCKATANPIYDSNGNIVGYSCSCGSYIGNGMCMTGALCSDGGHLNGTSDKCSKGAICPSGFSSTGAPYYCIQSVQCPDGGNLNGTTDKCSKGAICPSGFSSTGAPYYCIQSVQCPDGGNLNGTTDKCSKGASCPSGLSYNSTYNTCIQGAQCPVGGTFYGGTIDKCQANPYPVADVNSNDECTTQCNEACVGKPVSIATGTVYANETDSTINGIIPITFTRYYNNKSTTYLRSFGYMWASNFDAKVQLYTTGIYKIINPDGSIIYYSNKYGVNIYEADYPRGETSKLIKNANNTFKRIYKDGSGEEFNASGYLTAVVDKNGNRLTLTRDTSNRLTKITDPAGREINITSNTYNLITQITLPDAKTITYTYLGGILLQKITYPDGTYKTYEYSGYNLTGIKNEKGNYIEKHTYDAQGRGITSSADGTNDLLTLNYINDTQTTVTDSLGRTTTYTYDKSKGKGHLISRTGPGCQSCGQGNIAYTYDDKLNVTTETDALGNVTAYTYDANGNTLTKTEATGTSLQRTTTYTYNEQNDLTEQTGPTGTKTQFQYNTNRNLIKVLTLNSQLQTLTQAALTRDTKGQITKIQALDPNNQVLTETNIAYDTYGNITSITDAQNNTTTYTYDIMGKPLTATDANGKTTTLTYDQRARLISTKDSLNNITAYTYDQTGSLTALTDAKANATQFTYDLIGRLTNQTDPMAKQTIYTYDTQGNLTSKTDPNGNTIQYTYDALNRLIQKTYPDASTTTYQYDAIGNLTSASNAYISYSFVYDALNRMTSVTDSLGKSISYVYDANSNRTSMTSPIGTTSYTYNALNQLTQLVQGTQTFGFTYDSLGRRTTLAMPNGTTTSYSYDSLSRLLQIQTLKPNLEVINNNTYTYDNVGNKLTKQDTTGTHNYTYDNTYQLINATHPASPQETFSYDPVGNRNNTTVDAANKLLQDSNASYQYDNNGNRYIKTQTDGTITYYSYDYEGRLTRVETQKPGLTTVAVYKYDPLGRRFEKNSDGVITKYLYDGFNIVAEMDGNNNIIKTYTHNLAIDDPLALTTNGQTYYYHKDGLGSVVALTDSTGNVAQTYSYDSFGNITNQTGTINQPYTFTGREYDSESGLYYLRARELDSKTGTFTQKDPIGFAGGDTNLYRYVGNNPVNYIDPTGLFWEELGLFSRGYGWNTHQQAIDVAAKKLNTGNASSITFNTNLSGEGATYANWGSKSPIDMGSDAFSLFNTGWLSSSIGHELQHANDVASNYKGCRAEFEVRAYGWELNSGYLSKSFRKDVLKRYNSWYNQLPVNIQQNYPRIKR